MEVEHFGQVGAGTTVDIFDHPRAQLILRPQWVRDFREVGTVTVAGDSLSEDGIFDGDVLVIKRIFEQAELRSGKLVIALLPVGRSVVKRIHFEGDRIILRSANPRYKDMTFGPDEITVEGIVKELKRSLD
jgi:SOS-response transcriptional repressor LexA